MAESPRTDPINPTDDTARAQARALIAGAAHAALAVIEADTGHPFVSRIALAQTPDGAPMSLISTLSAHTRALLADPRCALLIGEPGRGDPLAHPRLTLRAAARFADGAEDAALRAHFAALRPKARLYAGFADFRVVVFAPHSAALNGGFARAYALTADDLRGAAG
ncbi:MAG: pyridoxamine 5'-phosphate oxidase family protein [Gemmobacter sp.]